MCDRIGCTHIPEKIKKIDFSRRHILRGATAGVITMALGPGLSGGAHAATGAIKATKGATFSFVVLGFSLAILSVLFSFAELLFIHSPTVIAIGVQILFVWLIFVLNLSIITTIYGHYVEGRPLR